MDSTKNAILYVRTLFARAGNLSALGTNWPKKERCENSSPSRISDTITDKLVKVCSDGRLLRKYLADLPETDRYLFTQYFACEKPAAKLAGELHRPLWRIYQDLNRLADSFIDHIDYINSAVRRDNRTGRFAAR